MYDLYLTLRSADWGPIPQFCGKLGDVTRLPVLVRVTRFQLRCAELRISPILAVFRR